MALTIVERQLVEDAYARGLQAFEERGLSPEDAKEFLSRKDVQDYLATVDLDATNQEVSLGRARYAARRGLIRLLPSAMQVLADSLRGPEYYRGPDGEIVFDHKGRPLVKEAAPTLGQHSAMVEVLNRLGVGLKPQADPVGGSVSVSTLLNQASEHEVEIAYGPAHLPEDQKSILRERVRNVIEAMAGGVLPKAKKVLETELKKPKKALKKIKSLTVTPLPDSPPEN